jgi:protein-disulfide isomerase
MSNKREREKRREERLQEETKVSSADRRGRLLQLGAGAVFLVIVAVVVLIVVNSAGSGSGGDAKNLEEVATVNKLLAGIPQEEMVLGDPKAKVNLIEFGDLQCPFCKAASEEVLPQVIEKQVRSGKAKITFRNFTIIGPESVPSGAATLAAGLQQRGWTYLELWYRNQGKENSGYVTEEFMNAIAKGAGVKDLAKWNKERQNKKLTKEIAETTEQAQNFGFTGTPSFAIQGPSTNGIELLSTSAAGSAQAIEEEIEKAG